MLMSTDCMVLGEMNGNVLVAAGTQKATFNGTGTPQNGQTTSVYTLDFQGNCTVKSKMSARPLTAQSA